MRKKLPTKTPAIEKFAGFPRETIRFLRALKRNNDRDWFNPRKYQYLEFVKAPSLAFVSSLVEPMRKLNPNIVITPKAMHRIYRDTRFSEDKTPYKTHVGFLFKDRRGDPDFRPSFYMGYDPTGIAYGAGIYDFTTLQRDYFRNRLIEPFYGKKWQEIVKKIRKKGRFEFRGKALKKMPRGFDPEHFNAEFFLHNGLYVAAEESLPLEFGSRQFTKRCMDYFAEAQPLVEWLSDFARSIPKGMEKFL